MYHNAISFSISHEGRLRLQDAKTDLEVGVNAAADSLALVEFPPALWLSICQEGGDEDNVLKRAFWDTPASSNPTLPRFTGEFKRHTGSHTANQLIIDMATFQSQLRALNINEILWGATYAGGIFEIFSSYLYGDRVRDLDLAHQYSALRSCYSTDGHQFSWSLIVDRSCAFPPVLLLPGHIGNGYGTIPGEPQVMLCGHDY